MSDFKTRLTEERKELKDKHDKLNAFIGSNENFNKIDPIQQELLKVQLFAMETYLSCLNARLKIFNQ